MAMYPYWLQVELHGSNEWQNFTNLGRQLQWLGDYRKFFYHYRFQFTQCIQRMTQSTLTDDNICMVAYEYCNQDQQAEKKKSKLSEIKTSEITSEKYLNMSLNDLSQGHINYTSLIAGRHLSRFFLKTSSGEDFIISSKQCITAVS